MRLTGAGEVTIAANQAGNKNYHSVSEMVSFEVTEESALSVESELEAIKFYPNPVAGLPGCGK